MLVYKQQIYQLLRLVMLFVDMSKRMETEKKIWEKQITHMNI